MPFRTRGLLPLVIASLVACSSTPVVLPREGSGGGGGGASATPTASGSGSASPTASATGPGTTPTGTPASHATPTAPATSTPSAGPTATPTPGNGGGGPGPSPTGTGNISCTTYEPLPGTYTLITAFGTTSGSAFTPDLTHSTYDVESYLASPSPTPSPVPTVSPTPTGSPTSVMLTIYVGTYSVPGFSATSGSTPYTASATSGCFGLVVNTSNNNKSLAVGNPQFQQSDDGGTSVGGGALTGFTLDNLTSTSGSGTFTLDNGATGTVNITGSVMESYYVYNAARKRFRQRPGPGPQWLQL